MKYQHTPVLLEEVLEYLNPQVNENFIDCTLGGGGHSEEILKKTSPKGKLLGIDLDPEAIKTAKKNLSEYKKRLVLVNDSYLNLKNIVYDNRFNKINGILLDLGLSNYELQDEKRGFSFKKDAYLDMRFGDSDQTAADILNTYKEKELTEIFKEYGEERHSMLIARAIVRKRKEVKITRTNELVDVIVRVYRNKPKPKNIHVATKVFQALRMEVNDELNNIRQVLPQALDLLEKNGRLVVISFHSLEDRIVKNFFRTESRGCICPPEIPECRCEHQPSLKLLTKKIVIPSATEINNNKQSRSARLRAIIKIN